MTEWKNLYQAAILETDWSQIEGRIQAADSAIGTRLHEFSVDHGGTPEENQEIADAVNGLTVLVVRSRLGNRSRFDLTVQHTTNLISQLQSIGGHDVATCEADQCQVHNAFLALRHRSDSGWQVQLWE
jgi:hypothetical protein